MEYVEFSASSTPSDQLINAVKVALRCAVSKVTLIGFSPDVAAPAVQLLGNAGVQVIIR